MNECKRLALISQYDSWDAKAILKLARTNVCSANSVKDFFPTEHNTCKMINRIRQENRARPPKKDGSNMLEFVFRVDTLPEEVPIEFYRGYVTSVYQGKTYRHDIFMTESARKTFKRTKLIIADSTFQICKEPHKQLLTIHAQVKTPEDGLTVNMPLVFVLMQKKSESAYTAVFQKIKDIVEEDGSSRVERIIVDYEMAMWNAMRAVWVNARVRGCWFHFCQCIYRKVQALKLVKSFYEHYQVQKMVKRLMCLPLIDANNIPMVFDRLRDDKYQDIIADNPVVKALFDYFEKQWIRGTGTGFKPEDYSVFRQLIRTTNIVESWNGSIFKEGNYKKHDIYQLAKLLARESADCEANRLHYASKKYKRRHQVEREKAIQNAYAKFDVNKQLMELLENLRKATKRHIRYRPTVLE